MPQETQAGHLDRRIVVERATMAANAFNELVPTWFTLVELWAMRRDASAAESYRAAEVSAQISTRFRVRYSTVTATVDEKDRISFEGKVYNITATRRIGRNQWIEWDAAARDDKRT
jgi:SPP1 family predicted phage head-tail adaptor